MEIKISTKTFLLKHSIDLEKIHQKQVTTHILIK